MKESMESGEPCGFIKALKIPIPLVRWFMNKLVWRKNRNRDFAPGD
jgi:hypothetical protein